MNNFGEFLYELRKEKGITQTELANELGVTNKAVSKWETGESMPETSLLVPISQIFGVTVDELLNGKRAENYDGEGEKQAGYDGESGEETIKAHLFTRGKDEEKTFADKVGGAVCACVFFLSLCAYLIIGVTLDLWHPYWVIIPVGALSCGVIGCVFDLCSQQKRRQRREKGENPYTGPICGIVVLLSVIVYLLLGALGNLWHPYWIIPAAGGVACGVIGAIGGIFTGNKK